MTSWSDEADLCNWLVDYLVTNIGSRPEEIGLDSPLNQLGLGSRDTLVLARELSEMLGRPVSPVDFWENPTINTLAHGLLNPDAEPTPGSVPGVGERDSLDEPIAVIGLGCRLPGHIHGPDAFWQFLSEGRSAVGELPDGRWQVFDDGSAEVCAALAGTTRWGSFLDDVAAFDAEYFDIPPREAERIDPQQRLLLEVAVEALDHAGIPPESLRRTQTGVFAGACVSEYGVLASRDLDRIDAWTCTGGALSIIANRLSYFLDIRGPSVTVDTACSSSLVAMHLAGKSLRTGESDLALAGGVNLVLSPAVTRSLDAAGAMSQSGACRAFDAGADGYVRGEGCGVVVLKRLSEALRDGNRVLAVVRGSAINQDGRSNGLMAPNPGAQTAVLRAACADAGVEPREVDYVEAHGSGTLLGDPIEARGLGSVYGRGRAPDSPLLIGSVKTNVGHLEAAAGVTGFIKATLAVQRGRIPASLHFDSPNPHIPFHELGLRVVDESTNWPSTGRPRRAGVSSFGFGGTNAHLVLEQAPTPASPSLRLADAPVTTLVVSAKTPERVATWAATLADWIEGPGAQVPLADVAATLAHRRARYPVLATVSACDRVQAVEGLRALARRQPAVGVVGPAQRRGAADVPNGTVFVYSGQGSQWTGMCRQLLVDEPAFAIAVAELEPDFIAQTGFSLQEVLSSGEPVTGIARIQPVLVGVQLALTKLWRSYRVVPDAVIGHSMGEVTAAVVAGALSVTDGLRVIATRSRLMSRLSGQGAMALLELDAEATTALVADYPDVTLAVYTAPGQTVIAGPQDQVHAISEAVRAKNRLARPVEVDVASHHPLIDPVLPELRTLLADLTPAEPTIPVLSTTREHDRAPVCDAQYWAENLRSPVLFHQAVAAAAQHHDTIVEVSPHPVLLHAVNDTLDSIGAAGRVQVLPTLNRENRENLFFHTQLATIAPPKAVKAGAAASRLADLPLTPWRHTRFWVAGRPGDQLPRGAHPLLGAHIELPAGGGHVWQGDVGTARHPWLADHKVHGQPILPASAFAEIVLAAACDGLKLPVDAVCVRQLEIEQMLPLTSETPLTTQVFVSRDGTVRVEVHYRTDNGPSGTWVRHAVARIETGDPASTSRPQLTHAAAGDTISTADYYAALRQIGQQHGPAFAGLTRITRLAGGGSETEIALPEEAPRSPAYRIHPVLLDSALQGLAAALPAELTIDRADAAFLSMSFDSIRVLGEVGPTAVCRAELSGLNDAGAGMLGRVSVFNESGTVAAEISGVCVRQVERRAVPVPLSQKVFDVSWVKKPSAEATAAPANTGSWLVLADSGMTAMARDLATKFGTPNRQVVTADLHDEQAVLRVFADAAAVPELPPRGVVVLAGGAALDPVGVEALAHTQETIWSIAAAVRAVVRGWHGEPPRLWLVTGGGLVAAAGEPGNPAVGALRGLVRVLAFEHPELHTTLVDLDPRDPSDRGLAALVTELQLADSDDVVAWRGGNRHVERLGRATVGAPHRDGIVRTDGSYVVTGGLGGLGLVVARWLMDRGAGRIILNGRSEPSEATRTLLDELTGPTQVDVVTGDIAHPGVAEALVAAAERTGLPLRGIVHSAAVIDDGLVITMKKESLHRVWAGKAVGALRLHHATVLRPLDWWVGFSSAASLLGSPGQGAYASANAWLDALTRWRRASGLPATAINWGQWSDVGVAQSLNYSALDPITPAEGIEALEALLAGDTTPAGVVRLRLDRVAASFHEIGDLGYFAALTAEAEELNDFDGSGNWEGPEALADLAPDEATRVVADRLRLRVLAIMGYPDDWPLEADSPLIQLGMDSLMAVRIRNTARADFGVEPPVALLLQGASLQDLTTDLVGQLGLVKPSSTERASDLGARAQQRAMARQDAVMERLRGHDA